VSPSPSNAWLSETEVYLNKALLVLFGLTSDLGPINLLPFCHFMFVHAARREYRGHFLPTSIYSGCGVDLVFTSHLLVTLSFALAIPPSLL
jgi:hypothetical protein